jgi:hypothetical protein
MAAVTGNMAFQLPVADFNTFASGTRKPNTLHGVEQLALGVAYFGPNVSEQVEGNREKPLTA